MKHLKLTDILWLLAIPAAVIALFIPEAWAQATATVTSTVTIDQLLDQGADTYEAFKTLGILGGFAALVNLVVNVSKFGPVREYIRRKKLKWIRPVLALAGGFLGGLTTAIAQGRPTGTAVIFSLSGLFAGGGAIAIHELYAHFKGERK